MRTIINGYSEDRTFLSNNLVSLLKWCYKKNVYFSIADVSNVKIEYDEESSVGRYNDGFYGCYLNVTYKDAENKFLDFETLFINSDDYTLSDAVENILYNKINDTAKIK